MTVKKKTKSPTRNRTSTVKRFLVFSGDQYYANGGWRDYRSSHSTLAEARRAHMPGDWWQIVDTASGQIVEES